MALLMKQVTAVIDDRTTYVCLHAAGQIVPVEAPFDTINGQYDAPPFHIHCRSISAPWMPGFGNDMAAEANSELLRRPEKYRDWRSFKGMPSPDDAPFRGPSTLPDLRPNKYVNATRMTPDPIVVTGAVVLPVPLDLDAATKVIDEMQTKWVYSRSDWRALRDYRGYGHEGMNEFLRRGTVRNPKGAEEQVESLKRLFRNAPTTPQSITVYRGIDASTRAVLADMLAEGNTMIDRGFLSTTLDRDVTRGFTGSARDQGAVMEILVPKGKKFVPANLEADGTFGSSGVRGREAEILFEPRTRLQITSVVEGKDGVLYVKAVMQ